MMRFWAVILGLGTVCGAFYANAAPQLASVTPKETTSAGPNDGLVVLTGACFLEDCEQPQYTVQEIRVLFRFGGLLVASTANVNVAGEPGSEQQITAAWPLQELSTVDGFVDVSVQRTSFDSKANDTRVVESEPLPILVVYTNETQPRNTPLRVGLFDQRTGAPVPDAWVIAERSDHPLGASMYLRPSSSNDSVYELLNANFIPYNVSVHAPGYFPKTVFEVIHRDNDEIDAAIELTPDPEFKAPGAVNVTIVLAPEGKHGPTHILARDAQIQKSNEDIGIEPVFSTGFMVFFGVPAGSYVLHVPDTEDFIFDSVPFTLGTGQRKSIAVRAQPRTERRTRFTGLPGQFAGTVYADGGGEPVPLEGAHVISTQAGSDYSTYTYSVSGGVYAIADAEPGLGQAQAFSPDGSIFGPAVEVEVVEGKLVEGADLTVPVDLIDADGNGLPDEFEEKYLQEVSADQAGVDGDPDRDGLTNLEEATALTHPVDPDSDVDKYNDAMEVVLGSNPNDPKSVPDLPNPMYVDFGVANRPMAGTLGFPFPDLDTALNHAQADTIIRIKGDVDVLNGPLPRSPMSKQVVIEAFNGAVTIGN